MWKAVHDFCEFAVEYGAKAFAVLSSAVAIVLWFQKRDMYRYFGSIHPRPNKSRSERRVLFARAPRVGYAGSSGHVSMDTASPISITLATGNVGARCLTLTEHAHPSPKYGEAYVYDRRMRRRVLPVAW